MEPKKQKKDTIYVGTGRKSFEYGINIDLCLDAIPEEFIEVREKSGKRWVRLTLFKLREPRKGTITHDLAIDTYKKEEGKE